MSYFTTSLVQTLSQKGFDLEEFFRQELETAVNQLLADELSAFLGYEPYSLEGHHTGNSRNGYYERRLETKYGTLHLNIPRDRQGQFKQALIPGYGRRTVDLEELVIQLYSKGMTTSEMANIIEKLYGHHYSPATVANITKLTEQSVLAFHERQLNSCYTAIFMDATYLHLRRETVAKEAVHIALGITSEGYKEVLGYKVAPNENLDTWAE